jgi:hypothetical protein
MLARLDRRIRRHAQSRRENSNHITDGTGTLLGPVSRESMPKQFVSLVGHTCYSDLSQTFRQS